MKLKIFIIILFISLANNIAYAQEQPIVTTLHPNASRFNPAELRQIFDIDYSAVGSVKLSTTIRGAELPQGNAYGIITAMPSENKILINGHYDISHDDMSISMRGDITVKKPVSPEIYPRITLNSGSLRINHLDFQCDRPYCNYININSETGWAKISGIASIFGRGSMYATNTGREELITTVTREDIINEQTTTAFTFAKNINVKPKPSPADDILVGLILRTEPNQGQISEEDRPQIGRFELIEANNAGYVLLQEPPYEELSGNAKLYSIIGPDLEISLLENDELQSEEEAFRELPPLSEAYPMLVHNGRNDIVLYASENNLQEELFRLKSGDIIYGYREGMAENICEQRKSSCIYFHQNGKVELKLTQRPRRSPFIGLLNLDSGILNSVDVKPFEIADTESRFIVKKPSQLGARSMVFTSDEIIIDGNWEDFGISFSGYTFDDIENRHRKLECRINERKCYLDERPITSISQTSQRCNEDEDCGEGTCQHNRCIEQRSCIKIIDNGDSATNIDLVIAGEDFNSIEEVREIAVGIDGRGGLIYGFGGLFNTEPFSRYSRKFNVWVQTVRGPDAPTEFGPNTRIIRDIDLSNCPEANIQIIASKRDFRSYASFETERCVVSLAGPRSRNPLFMHEFGHCFGHLADEYYEFRANRRGNPVPPNCIIPEQDKGIIETALERWSSLLCGRRSCSEASRIIEQEAHAGCGGDCDERCRDYLRPSENSVMRYQEASNSFNTVSRAWLEKKIRGWS